MDGGRTPSPNCDTNPYANNFFHDTPVMFLLGRWLTLLPDVAITVVFALVDLSTAALLSRGYPEHANAIFLTHCLNPMTFLCSQARSTQMFNGFFVALALAAASQRKLLFTIFTSAVASFQNPYYFLLAPSLIGLFDMSVRRRAVVLWGILMVVAAFCILAPTLTHPPPLLLNALL